MRQFHLDLPAGSVPRPGERHVLDSEESHHLATVLRGGRDDVLHLVDGRGLRLTARAVGGGGKRQEVEILTTERDESELQAPRLVLACAVVKGRRFEWVLEKAVELGAHAIVPLVTARGTVQPRGNKRSRWQTILVSALKQSGRSLLPELEETTSLERAIGRGGRGWFGAVPAEGGEPAPEAVDLQPEGPLPDELVLWVGPEGGWTPAEEEKLVAAGARPVGLGPHVLRTETAAIVGLFALQGLRRRWIASEGASGS